jgi:hypothetical protein
MKRTLVTILIVATGLAAFAVLVYAVLGIARVAEPDGTTVQGLTARRLWASIVALLALAGAIIGGRAVSRPSSSDIRSHGAKLSVGLGLIGLVNGALNLALATGGPGTGNGVVGAAAAVVLGLVAVATGGIALSRTRRSLAHGR